MFLVSLALTKLDFVEVYFDAVIIHFYNRNGISTSIVEVHFDGTMNRNVNRNSLNPFLQSKSLLPIVMELLL
jgi:hypothetical protein